MPRALTEDQKYERLMQRKAETTQSVVSTQQSTEPNEPVASRRRRGTFNGTEAKLAVHGSIPGYHMHVFTDAGGRIQSALDNGYEFVRPSEIEGVSENVVSRNGDLGDRIRFLVNPRAEGSEQYGYLMKIRQEWHEEDQADLQAKNAKIDAAIRKGKTNGGDPSFYVPQGGINMKQT